MSKPPPFPPYCPWTANSELSSHSQRLFKRLNRHSIATLFSISNSQIFDSETQRWGIFERWSLFLFSFSYFRDTQCLKIAQKVALRAERATFTFWVAKSSLKMPKLVNFGELLKTWSLRSNSVTRHVTFIQIRHFWWFTNNVNYKQHFFFLAVSSSWREKSGSLLFLQAFLEC